jgi:O-antigen/teichoic acid export membrane protein
MSYRNLITELKSPESRGKLFIFAITTLMSLAALLANIVLARILPLATYGKIGFVLMIAPLLAVASMLGQDVFMLRLCAGGQGMIRWKPSACKVMFKSAGVLIIVIVSVFVSAGYSIWELIPISILGLACMVTCLLAFCFRGLQRDIIGLVLVRLVPLFLLGIASICYFTGRNSPLFILTLLAVGYLAQLALALAVFFSMKDGNVEPDSGGRVSAKAIFFYNIGSFMLLQGDRFLCKSLYGFEMYGIYHASKLIVRPIELVVETIAFYSLPRLAQPPFYDKVQSLFKECLTVAGSLAVAYFVFGKFFFRLLLGNNFHPDGSLIFGITLLALVILVQVPFANFIQAGGRKKQLIATGGFSIACISVVSLALWTTSRFVGLPLIILPLGLALIYILRMVFIWKRWGNEFWSPDKT